MTLSDSKPAVLSTIPVVPINFQNSRANNSTESNMTLSTSNTVTVSHTTDQKVVNTPKSIKLGNSPNLQNVQNAQNVKAPEPLPPTPPTGRVPIVMSKPTSRPLCTVNGDGNSKGNATVSKGYGANRATFSSAGTLAVTL